MWGKEWQIDVWRFCVFGACPEGEAAGEGLVAWAHARRAAAPGCADLEMTAAKNHEKLLLLKGVSVSRWMLCLHHARN